MPRPVYGHGLVYIATGFQQPALHRGPRRRRGRRDEDARRLDAAARRAATPSPLLVGDELYVVSDTGIAPVVDATTGAIHWQQRLGGNFSASPVFADGRIYFLGEDGVATVIAPGREFKRLATNTLDGATLASMAVSGGSIFIRSATHLYRIGKS